MQIAPSELRSLSLWQFAAMVSGWNEANKSGDDSKALKPEDEEHLEQFIAQPSVWVH